MANKWRNFFSPEQETEIVNLYEEGQSIAQIANRLNVSRTPVVNCLSRHEVQLRPRGGRPLKESERIFCACGNAAIYRTKGQCSTCYYRERNKDPEIQERRFNWKLQKNFGITREDYDRILEEQGGVCAICKKPEQLDQRLSVDHDHSCCPGWYGNCGKCTRGILCHNCNSGVGYFKESIENAENLIAYLRKYQQGSGFGHRNGEAAT